jgi:DNA-binding PadR family transcriptional regulator
MLLLPKELEFHVLCELAAGETWGYEIMKSLNARNVPVRLNTVLKILAKLRDRGCVIFREEKIVRENSPERARERTRGYVALSEAGLTEQQNEATAMKRLVSRIDASLSRASERSRGHAEGTG